MGKARVVGKVEITQNMLLHPSSSRDFARGEALKLVEDYVKKCSLKRIPDVRDLAREIISNTETNLSMSTIADACYMVRERIRRDQDIVFDEAVRIAIGKFAEGLTPPQVMNSFTCELSKKSPILKMPEKVRWASIFKARDIYEGKISLEK